MNSPHLIPWPIQNLRLQAMICCAVLAVFLPVAIQADPRPLGPTGILSVPGISQAAGGADSFSPFFSEDGRFLFFQSLANDLVSGDTDAPVMDFFRYELASGLMIRVSDGTADWDSPSVSSNGERVVFSGIRPTSRGHRGDSGITDVYLRDIIQGTTRLVSVSSNGVAGGNGDSIRPLISADGRVVAFESYATDLADGVPPGSIALGPRRWLFVRDLEADRVVASPQLIDGSQTFSHHHSASLSADGHRMAFTREVRSPRPSSGRVVVMDVGSGAILWWSTNYATTTGVRAGCLAPQLSRDGRWVAFVAQRAPDDLVILHDLETGDERVATNSALACVPLVFSVDQSHLVFERLSEFVSWDLQTDEKRPFPFGMTVFNATQSRWSQVALDATGAAMIYRGDAGFVRGRPGFNQPAIYLRRLSDSEPVLISGNADGIAASPESIGDPAISPDGRWAAFQASDCDVVQDDRNHATDVFLRDLQTGLTHIISRHPVDVTPSATPSALVFGMPATAADGRTVVFSAGDGNLAESDTNNSVDVFLQDGAGGPLRRLTENPGITSRLYQRYVRPQISADGNSVAFVGQQSRLVDGYAEGSHLYHLELPTGKLQIITAAAGPIPPLPTDRSITSRVGDQAIFSLSADGRWVAFQDYQISGVMRVSLWDVEAATNQVISVRPSGVPGGGISSVPTVSKDGKQVLFLSTANDLLAIPLSFGPVRLYLRDLVLGSTRLVSPAEPVDRDVEGYVVSADATVTGWWYKTAGGSTTLGDVVVSDLRVPGDSRTLPGMFRLYGLSADGRFAAGLYRQDPAMDPFSGRLCRVDTRSGEIIPFHGGSQWAFWSALSLAPVPVISADGRFIAFESDEDSLVAGDDNGTTDVFVRDVVAGVTVLASVNRQGTHSGNGPSSTPVLGGDGQTLIFRSWASDLVAGDFNSSRDFFTLRLTAGDGDHDGLPDDWEIAYFGTLDRDGSGDLDGDGVTDAAEYAAGTNPTNDQSILRAMILLTGQGGGQRTILWSAVAGKRYQVQSRPQVEGGVWSPASGVLRPLAGTGSWTDPNPAPMAELYYRVILVE